MPAKTPQVSESPLAREARDGFWAALHGGLHEKIPDVAALLTAAYLENPRDPGLARLLALTHLWALVERDRSREDPRTTDHAILADRYFSEARRLAPDDLRIPGWHGAVKLALGRIHQDEEETREGYLMLEDAARRWPEFNHFSAAYPMSPLPPTDPLYREAIEHLWRNMDACFTDGRSSSRIDRSDPASSMRTDERPAAGPKRVCWNSSMAPHNFEGFFLNFGDMVLKTGDVETARKLYRVAQSSDDYASWPYREVLEERLASTEPAALGRPGAPRGESAPETMFDSRYNCLGCHRRE
jgi:hypothetical protein